MTPIKNQKSKIKNSLILASASPRRARLLRAAGIPFKVLISPAPEPELKPRNIPVELWPMHLAYLKARAAQQLLNQKSKIKNQKSSPPILAADTIVLLGQKILNKPRNRAHARQMLLSLMGHSHRVITGIALLTSDNPTIRLLERSATCHVRRMPKSWLSRYLDSNLWQGKAGGYGLQDSPNRSDSRSDPFVRLKSGHWSTVVGLPMPLVLQELHTLRKEHTP